MHETMLSLTFMGQGDYLLKNNVLTSRDQARFIVEYYGTNNFTITPSNVGKNNITGHGSIIINDQTITLECNNVHINNQLYVPANSTNIRTENGMSVNHYRFKNSVATIKIAGSASITAVGFGGPGSLKIISSCGSGSLDIQNTNLLYTLTVIISGSGLLRFTPTTSINIISIRVSGSGSVSGFHVVDEARLAVSGSGVIIGTKKPNASISKFVSGTGHIQIE